MLQLGNVEGAEKDVVALVNLAPNSTETQTLLGDFYWSKKDYPRAKSAYMRAAQMKSDSIDALKGLIRVDLAQKAPDAARARVESRLAKAPNDTALLLLAGNVLKESGDAQAAEAMYMRVLQADPSNMDAYNNLGDLYISQNRLEDAKKQYVEAARKQPKTAVAATTMVGIILTLQNKHAEARQQYQQAIAIDPQAAVAANNLAWDYAENGGATLDVALSLAQTAKARLPSRWEASDTLGWIYYKKGLASLAVTAFRQGAEQNPSNPTVQYHLGLAHLKNGDRPEAQKALQRALTLDPKFAAAEDAKRVLATIKG
jgi:tetratricopeptide (TPR) repeat protein